MKRQYSLIGSLVFMGVMVLVIGPKAYADEMPSVRQMDYQFEHQLTTRDGPYGQPKATSYYDDLVDHYEQVLIMSDFIDKGIR